MDHVFTAGVFSVCVRSEDTTNAIVAIFLNEHQLSRYCPSSFALVLKMNQCYDFFTLYLQLLDAYDAAFW